MTLTLMSLLCDSKSGRSCRNASRRLFAAAMVRVSGAACTDGTVRMLVVNAAKSNRLLNSRVRPVITYLLVIVIKFSYGLRNKIGTAHEPGFRWDRGRMPAGSGTGTGRVLVRGCAL